MLVRESIMTVEEYQELLEEKCHQIFKQIQLEKEWSISLGREDIYAPRLDLAVGPFSYGTKKLGNKFDLMMTDYEVYINEFIKFHNINIEKSNLPKADFQKIKDNNINARCFLAIEIENKVGQKHLIGGAINACSMGRIGLFIGWNERTYKYMIRLLKYLFFLKEFKNIDFPISNLLVLNKDQLDYVLFKS